MTFWMRLVLAVLATWRVTHLLASEDGPADLVVRLRVRLGSGFLGRLMDCFYCLSLWVAAPLAFFVGGGLSDWIITWLALSGAACLLERLGQPPAIMSPAAAGTKGEVDNVLRSEASGSQDDHVAYGYSAGDPPPRAGRAALRD
ncbi:MAG TPA: DUF1360 domain-containing protein [bacterium]|nr:DUF1360 domain-containing protein [bacterium]